MKPGNLRETAWCQIRRCESKDEGNPKLQSAPPCGALFSYLLPSCHSEPVRTLAWESASPDVRRNSLHSVSAVTVSAAKTAYPLLPSSSPNQSRGFDLEKENRGNGYGAVGPKPGCGMECARLDADCHTSDVGHWFAMTLFYMGKII